MLSWRLLPLVMDDRCCAERRPASRFPASLGKLYGSGRKRRTAGGGVGEGRVGGESGGGPSGPLARYAEALRRVLRDSGRSQRQFARAVPTSESNLSEILAGRRLPAQALAASIAARLGAAGNGLQELYEQARAAKYPAVSAAGLPAEVVGLLRRMLQVTESLPYRLDANAAVSLSSVYVRQSVAAPAESRKVRTEEVRIEDGIDGVRVESVRV